MKKIFITSLVLIFSIFLIPKIVSAYGECDQYGIMSIYDQFSNTCSCMSGYSFGKDFLGQTSCISNVDICHDKYGYNSTSDYAGSCKCNYGYAFGKDISGKTQCISLNTMCVNQLGYNSSYDSLSDSCKCGYGYIIKNGQCVNGNNFCSSQQGLHSTYDTYAKQCSCDSGYTLKDGQCVEKQNNVYFTLKELDTENRKAVVKSDYDYSYYAIEYNSGCYDSSFKRYLNNQIVINLGTDFDLDTWDKIVLQDDDETCDITYRERVDSSFSLETKDNSSDLMLAKWIAMNEASKKNVNSKSQVKTTPKTSNKVSVETNKGEVNPNAIVAPGIEVKQTTPTEAVKPIEPPKKVKWYKKVLSFFKKK